MSSWTGAQLIKLRDNFTFTLVMDVETDCYPEG
jgi:hypothetical protein